MRDPADAGVISVAAQRWSSMRFHVMIASVFGFRPKTVVTPSSTATPSMMAVEKVSGPVSRSHARPFAEPHAMPVSLVVSLPTATKAFGVEATATSAVLGHRRIADRLGVPAATVRGWLRRFAARAGHIRAVVTGWAHRLDATVGRITPRGSPFDDALEALGVAVDAAIRVLGPARSPWHVAAALTGAAMLSTGTIPAR